ncbi:hypothetical protein ACHAW6_007977 [Cyclotella cf. meneghiniana]
MDDSKHQEFLSQYTIEEVQVSKIAGDSDLPEDVIAHYKLQKKATLEGFVCVEIQKGMYGLPQAGLLAQELLEKRLNEKGFRQLTFTPGLWTHSSKQVQFTQNMWEKKQHSSLSRHCKNIFHSL